VVRKASEKGADGLLQPLDWRCSIGCRSTPRAKTGEQNGHARYEDSFS